MRDVPSGLSGDLSSDLLDRAHLAAQTFGEADLAAEVLALFCAQCRLLLPAIADPAGPCDTRADLAHTLRGAALGVGASAVARHGDAVEARLRAGSDPGDAMDGLRAAVAATLALAEAGPGRG